MKFNPETLEIENVWANRLDLNDRQMETWGYPENERHQETFGIEWSCNLGFGICQFKIKDGGARVVVDSETMCTNENKEFLRALLNKFCDIVEIEE